MSDAQLYKQAGNAVTTTVIEAIGRQPEASGAITRTMIIGDALAETTGLYSLIIAILLMFANPFIGQLG